MFAVLTMAAAFICAADVPAGKCSYATESRNRARTETAEDKTLTIVYLVRQHAFPHERSLMPEETTNAEDA